MIDAGIITREAREVIVVTEAELVAERRKIPTSVELPPNVSAKVTESVGRVIIRFDVAPPRITTL